jgi:hypothetical protein
MAVRPDCNRNWFSSGLFYRVIEFLVMLKRFPKKKYLYEKILYANLFAFLAFNSFGNQGIYAQDNRAVRVCNKFQDDMVRMFESAGKRWSWSREEVLAGCIPQVNALLRSGVQACISTAISGGETPNSARTVCNMYASISESLGIAYSGGLNLPFQSNCAAMQKYLNTQKWDKATRFQGFENSKFSKLFGNYVCLGGYITETSPMGTRVCIGAIQYGGPEGYEPKATWVATNGERNCRWK